MIYNHQNHQVMAYADIVTMARTKETLRNVFGKFHRIKDVVQKKGKEFNAIQWLKHDYLFLTKFKEHSFII